MFVCFFLCDTFTSIPYYAFTYELTYDYDETNSVFFWNNGFGQVGTLVGMALPAIITVAVSKDQRVVMVLTGLFFALVHIGGLAAILAWIKEEPPWEKTKRKREEAKAAGAVQNDAAVGDKVVMPFVVNLLRCFGNVAFIPLIKSFLLDYLSVGLIAAMMPFYIKFVLLDPQGGNAEDTSDATYWTGLFATCFFGAAVFFMPLWLWLGKKLGKRNAWLLYNFWNSVTNPWFAVCGTNKSAAMVVCFLNGSAVGGQFFIESVTADVVEYDVFLHGDNIEAAFVAIQSFVPKIVLIFANSLPLSLIAWAGFRPSVCPYETVDGIRVETGECDVLAPEPQTQQVKTLIMWLFCIIPAIATFVSLYWKMIYPIKTQAIADGISLGRAKHADGESAVDPITGLTVSPMCVSTVADAEVRDGLVLLSHFSHASIQGKKGSQIDAGSFRGWLTRDVVVSLTVFVAALVAAGSTFNLLDNARMAWMPTIACIVAGAVSMFAYVSVMRFRLLPQLKNGVNEESARLYNEKLSAPAVVGVGL